MRNGNIYIKGPIKLEAYSSSVLTVDLGSLSKGYDLYIYTGTSAFAAQPEGWRLPNPGTFGKTLIFLKNASTNNSLNKIRCEDNGDFLSNLQRIWLGKTHQATGNRIWAGGDVFALHATSSVDFHSMQWYEPPL